MTEPEAVLRSWFDAFARGDLDAGRHLLADDAPIHPDPSHPNPSDPRGFDEFVSWYQQRRTSVDQFSYELHHLVTTEQHAVALLTLRALDGEVAQEWQQVAVYRVEKGQIREMWAFEDERKR